MRYRLLAAIIAVSIAAGCADEPVVPELEPADAPSNGFHEQTVPDDLFSATGEIDLMFYDQRPAEEGPRQPTFKVSTPSTTIVEGGRVAFEDAHAVIFGRDETKTRLQAAYGEFDQQSREASLSGGVTLETGTMQAKLEDVIWRNEDRMARSENPVVIVDLESRLEAASFTFRPEDESLYLTNMTGSVVLESEDVDPADGPTNETDMPAFTRMTIANAPEVHMQGGRFESITGGVVLRLEAADPDAEPMELRANEAWFTYVDGPLPSQVELRGAVEVTGPPGAIRSEQATMELAERRFVFESNVRGASPPVEEFRAERLTYMPGLIKLDGSVYVSSPQGTVHADNAELKPEQDTMVFTGNVDMASPDGRIRADQAEVDENRAVFTGNVRGAMADIKEFRASRIIHSMKTGDAELFNLQVRDMDLGQPDGDESEGPISLRRMTIERAPRVVLTRGRVERITGGVDFVFSGDAPESEPMHIRSEEARFIYTNGEEGNLPSEVRLIGGVTVDGPLGRIRSEEAQLSPGDRRFVFTRSVRGSTPEIRHFEADELTYAADRIYLDGNVAVEHTEGDIRADQAELDTTTQHMVFTGNVSGSMPQVQGLTAERLRFDPTTETVELDQAKIDRFGEEEPQVVELSEADVQDWGALLDRMQEQAESDVPNPGNRVISLLPSQIQEGLERRPRGTRPDEATQHVILNELNRILKRRDLYDEDVWEGVALDPSIVELAARDPLDLTDAEVAQRNHGLLRAAYPDLVASHDENG